jgi:caffeoyl-CoA O-methyltransferase
MKGFGSDNPAVSEYCVATFVPEDEFLLDIRRRAKASNLPDIHVGPFDGRHIEVLTRAIGAKKVVEIGTLAGLSGTCIGRALPTGGVLHTFEFDPKHAAVAEETFARAGLKCTVRVHVGAALDKLPAVESEGPFDLVFIDADKVNYPNYVRWAAQNVRIGGTVLVDNAFAWGLVGEADGSAALQEEPRRKARQSIMEANALLADPTGPFRATMLPTGEGLAMGVRMV